jgi:hypothetical protein
MGLPKEIFVTNEHPKEEGGWYNVNLSPEDAVGSSDEKEPINVGTYRLVEENTLELVRTVRLRKAKQPKTKK